MRQRPQVCIIGLGYIGLPTAATLARAGHSVVGVDVNPAVVEGINAGRVHIVEPDLPELVREMVASGRLWAGANAVLADTYLICVPTPLTGGGPIPTPDISHVLAAARSIAGVVGDGGLVIIESTCPVGTTEQVRDELGRAGAPVDLIHLAYCPERVLPGRILDELTANDRIIGGIDEASSAAAVAFYESFVTGSLLTTTSRTAEMVKLVENSYRDVNIAFANEVSILSEHLDIDAWEVIRLANRHPRVQILQPGPGVGGHCIAVDPWFIVAQDPEEARLIRTAREVNDAKTDWVVSRILEEASRLQSALGRPIRVACLGLAYKPDVDDLRESPAVRVAREIKDAGIDVIACEPHIETHPVFELHTADDAIAQADLVAILVRHTEFLGRAFGEKPVLDFCGATRTAGDLARAAT